MVCGCKSGCNKTEEVKYVDTGSLVTDMYTSDYGYSGDCYNQPHISSQISQVKNQARFLQAENKLKIAPVVILSVAILGLGFLLVRGRK